MKREIAQEQGSYIAKGTRVYLRELLVSDVTERYLSWFRDESVIQFLHSKYLSYEDVIQYITYGKETKSYFMYAICVFDNELHIGNVKIGPINWSSMRSDLVTMIGDTAYWGQGIATEAISLGNELAFDVYEIKELAGHIDVANVGSLKSYFRTGWAETKRISDPGSPELVCVSCFNPKYYSVKISEGKFQSVQPRPSITIPSQ